MKPTVYKIKHNKVSFKTLKQIIFLKKQAWDYSFKSHLLWINNNLKKISNDALQNEYNLSEIIFSAKDKLEFEEKSKKIYQSIEIDGFESSAIIYNENTLNKKGNIGWISESQLNEKINKSLKKPRSIIGI